MTHPTSKSRLSCTALAIAVSTVPQITLAQQGSSGFALEEIIVTAQKRAEDLQSVAISAQAFNAEDIRVMGIDSVAELIYVAPSMNAGGLGSGSQQLMGIRGIVDYSRNPGIDPRMGVYVDEVYQGQGYSADQPLLGLQSVEILRGPQGTLFGKNTVSGAINLVTKDPTEITEGELAATYGNEGQAKLQAYLSGGLSSNVFGSIAVTYDERDGFYNNTTLNAEAGAYDRTSVRGKLRFVPSEAWDIGLTYDYSKRDSTEPVGTEASLPRFEYRANVPSADKTEFWGIGLHANYTLPSGYQIVSITSYRDAEFSLSADDDMTPFAIQTTVFDEFNEQITQEFRLQSPEDQNFTWLVGAYFFDSERSTARYARFDADLYNVLIPALATYSNQLAGSTTVPSMLEHTSYAAFFHGDLALTDQLSLTLGVRYTRDEKTVDWRQLSTPDDPATAAVLQGATGLPLTQAPGALFGAINYSAINDDRDENDWAPTASLNYQLSDDTLLYGRYARAAKSGGYNAEFMTAGLANFEYDQETVNSLEVGIKTSTLSDTLRLNLAAFEMAYDDFQVFQFLSNPDTGATSLQLTNAGEVSVTGVETEITWVPTPSFRLQANVTVLDAKYDVFENPAPGGTPFSGNQLPYAPDLKYYLGAQYIMAVASGNITFDVDYTYVDDQFTDPGNLAIDRIDSYNLLGARAAYTPASEDWEVALWGRNLSDEEFTKVNNDNFLGFARTVWGDPRLYGITFTYFLGN